VIRYEGETVFLPHGVVVNVYSSERK